MHRPRIRSPILLLASLASCLMPARGAAAAQPIPSAVLVRIGAEGKPEVVPIDRPGSAELRAANGLLIWTDRGRESWQALPPAQRALRSSDALEMVSRFGGTARSAPAPGYASTTLTVQLDQLIGQTVFRGGGLLTPAHGGYCLDPKITIRRCPRDAEPEYPDTALVLRQGNRTLLRIAMREGQPEIAWAEIPGLDDRLREGLAPGEYTLSAEDGGESTTFFVEQAEIRDWVMEVPGKLEPLVGTREHPLYLQVAAAGLLAQTDEAGRPRPYAADALDLLESAPAEALTPYLRQLREDVLARLRGESPAEPGTAAADPTGVPQIDAARELILIGKWEEALAALDAPELERTQRSLALATLYRAVILSESGQATDPYARDLFRYAIQHLEGNASDAYRARNNYANCLLARAQDRLYNHAFQMASGVSYPLSRALIDWRESLAQYEAARASAQALGPGHEAAVRVNTARLYALLADVIRTLDPPTAEASAFPDGWQAASYHAWRLATDVLAPETDQADPVVRAAAAEILAHLAFRRGDADRCREHAEQAIRDYLNAGALAGVESAHRTLGILELRQAESARDPGHGEPARKAALRHLLISQRLSEFLREQIPADRIGLSRAGFFARRAYVNEQICRLLVAERRDAEALRYVELAKARALEDVLAAGGAAAGRGLQARGLAEILAGWPEGVAAVEYFLGTDEAWLFLIDTSGKVTARTLTDDRGRALASRDLVARVRTFLAGIEQKAPQMRQRLSAGMGYDSTWQDELYELYRQLLPGGVMEELRKAGTVLVVPHHVLHYFPFAALVTEPDRSPRTIHEMVKPRFLLDEPFDLAYAPSLSAWDLLREGPDRPIRQVNASGIVEFDGVEPLPGVEKDLANLKAAFGPMIQTVLSEGEATETRAKAILNRAGLLLLATHGLNFADQPLASYLMFRADGANDGYLTAGELYSADVGADLVVMSACYSGLADRSPLPGDDLFGIQRALLRSGARTVVSGLWDVYDGTGPELMKGFFQQLAAGRPVPAALANSERALLNRLRASERVEPWLHPYFWAVYTSTGDDRTRLAAEGN